MRVKVLGKNHIEGTSKKTGKPFATNIVHVCFPRNGVDGQAVETIFLSPETYPLDKIVINGTYEVDRDGNGFLLCFEQVKSDIK